MSKQTGTRAAKARAQKSGATPRQIKVQFTLDPQSCTGKKFGLAVHHYSGGALLSEEFGPALAKLIVADWLDKAITFPTLWLGGRPPAAPDAPDPDIAPVMLTRLDLERVFGSAKVLRKSEVAHRLEKMNACSYQTAMRILTPGRGGYLTKHFETTAEGWLRLHRLQKRK